MPLLSFVPAPRHSKGSLSLLLLLTFVGLGGCTLLFPHIEDPAALDVASDPPALYMPETSDRVYWEPAFAAVYEVLLRNLHGAGRFHPTRHAHPSPIFLGVFLWDTAFIAQVWKPWDAETAQEIVQAVLHHRDEGRLQHYANRFSHSELTQPPLVAWSVWETYRWNQDDRYLADVYPVLRDYNRWLYAHRRLPSGLFFWEKPYESGMDNSPRFSSQDEADVRDTRRLAAVDLSSYMVVQNETLAHIAETLGHTDEAAHYTRRAGDLRTLLDSKLWDEETGYYYDLDLDTNRLIKVVTSASLLPLFAGVPDGERAARLRDQITDPDAFHTLLPLPTVARSDPHFAKDMWRGPVWINLSYMVIEGLKRYGFERAAAELAFRTVDGVYQVHRHTGQFFEFYDPERFDIEELHRKHGNRWKQLTLGDKPRPHFVGWTGLVNTLLIEHLVGIRRENGCLSLRPRFPDQAAGLALTLTLPAESLTVEMEVLENGNVKGSWWTPNERRDFSLAFGEPQLLERS